MTINYLKIIFIFFLLISSCRPAGEFKEWETEIRRDDFRGTVRFTPLPKGRTKVQSRSFSGREGRAVLLDSPVFKVLTVDFRADGRELLCVGMIKKTHFDPQIKKRLQLLRTDGDFVRPEWLGSQIGGDLEDFSIEKNPTGDRIRLLYRQKNGRYSAALFGPTSFGLFREKMIFSNLPADRAFSEFQNQ